MKRVFTLFFLFVVAIGAWADGTKVAMLICSANANSTVDNDIKDARDWFSTNYSQPSSVTKEIVYLNDLTSETVLAQYNTVWIYMDDLANNNDLPTGMNNTHIAYIKSYVQGGGNILLTGQACKIAAKIDRAPATGTYGNASSANGDTWGISAKLRRTSNNTIYDHTNHPLFNGLSTSQTNTYPYYPLVNTNPKQDHNCMWNFSNGEELETKYNCIVLGTWQQVDGFDSQGVVEFLPMGDYKGRIIAIGVAAYQWDNNTTSENIANVKQLTANGINYLLEKHTLQESKETRVAYLLPVNINADKSDKSAYQSAALNAVDQDDEKTALKWFIDEIVNNDKGDILEPEDLDDLDPNYYTTMWVHIDRDATDSRYLISNWTNDNVNVLALERSYKLLCRYVKNGGNLLLTKHAVQLVGQNNYIGRSTLAPNVVEAGSTIEENNHMWAINAVIGGAKKGDKFYDGYTKDNNRTYLGTGDAQYSVRDYLSTAPTEFKADYRSHYLYHNMTTNSSTYPDYFTGTDPNKEQHAMDINKSYDVFQIIGNGVKENHNCIWNENGLNVTQFQSDNNCTVLGQWGQKVNEDNAVVVDFYNTINKGTINNDGWEGHILCIGLGAYEWQQNKSGDGSQVATENPYLNNIKQLTYNALNILENNIDDESVTFTINGVTYLGTQNNGQYYATILNAVSDLEKYDIVSSTGVSNGIVSYNSTNYTINDIALGAFLNCQRLAYADLTQYNGSMNKTPRPSFPAHTLIYLKPSSALSGENLINTSSTPYTCEHLRLYDNEAGDPDYIYHLYANKYEFTANKVSFNRTFTQDVKSTIVLPFAISAEELPQFGTFYKFASVDNNDQIRFVTVSETEAYKPYMIVPTGGEIAIENVNKVIATLDNQSTNEVNYKLSTSVPCQYYTNEQATSLGANFIGEFRPQEFSTAKSQGIYSYKSDGTFKTTTGKIYADPFRAYLKLNTPPTTAKVFRAVFEDFTPTGIFNANADEETNDGAYYTLQGIKVSNPGPGIYIHNKKKIIIKK